MINNKISQKQLFIILFICKIISYAINMPNNTPPDYSGNIWISSVIKTFLSFIFILPFIYVAGKPKYIAALRSNIILRIVLFIFLMFRTVLIGVQFTNLASDTILPRGSMLFIIITICVFSVYASVKGVETIARIAQLLLPFLIIGIIIIIALSFIDADYSYLPDDSMMFSVNQGILGALTSLGNNTELVIFILLLPYLKSTDKVRGNYFKFNIILCVFEVVISISMFITFGKYIVNINYPFFSIARNIHITSFFERLESIYLALWIVGVFIILGLLYYLIKDIMGIESRKIYIFIILFTIVFTAFFSYSHIIFNFISQSAAVRIINMCVIISIPFIIMLTPKKYLNMQQTKEINKEG